MQRTRFQALRTGRAALISVLFATLATTAAAQSVGAGPQPVTQALPYVDLPRISSVKVSPSNTHAAFLWRGNEGRLVLAVVDLAQPSNVRVVAGNKDLNIRNVHWVSDRRLVFDAVPPELRVYEGDAAPLRSTSTASDCNCWRVGPTRSGRTSRPASRRGCCPTAGGS